MIRTIIKREFLDNILSFKFIACVLVAVILTLISTIFLTRDYQARLGDYRTGITLNEENLKHVPVYSRLALKVFKKPNPLSIFVTGIERETGTYVDIDHRDIPASLRGGLIKNEFSHMFYFLDMSSVIVIVFTLLAILLSYNVIADEKERGTLSVALSNAVPRYTILIGKYLGVLISLVTPLVLLFLFGILIVVFSRNVEIDSSFPMSMGILFGYSVLYLSSIVLIGLFLSTRIKRSFTSLLVFLSFYLFTVFLMPLAVNSYADRQMSLRTRTFERNLPSLTDERGKAVTQSLAKIPRPPRGRAWMLPSSNARFMTRIVSPDYIEFYKNVYPIREKVMEEYAIKIESLREIDDAAAARIRRWRDAVLSVIPSANFVRIVTLEAETGEDNLTQFIRQLKTYWQSYVRYLDEKTAFGLKYFYPYPEEFTPQEKELIERINKDYVRGKAVAYTGKYLEEAQAVKPPIHNLDLSDLPAFVFHNKTALDKIGSSLPNILILFVFNLAFFLMAHFSFNRYDPRKDS